MSLVDLLKSAATVDFESLSIDGRPHYPPVPVGVAVQLPGESPKYLAWAHPSGGNNCSWSEAQEALQKVWDSGAPILGHNNDFDVDVAETHMGMPRLPWDRYLDTVPALFLLDPRASTYSLKPSAEMLLGQAQEERDAVEDWLITNQPVPGIKISRAKKSENYAGAYIGFAPPSLVGPYAIGDLTRTEGLAAYAFEKIEKQGMVGAYDRERQLMPILLDMERQGLRVDTAALERDIYKYQKAQERLEEWLRKRLGVTEINFDSNKDLAKALIKAKVAKERDFGITPTGQMAVNKEALEGAVKDKQVLATLTYRSQLCTSLSMFMRPWLDTASQSGGLIFTQWHSTRQDHSSGSVGARTGRLSSTPNLQNVPSPEKIIDHFKDVAAPVKLPPLPSVRRYILPYEKGHVIIGADFSSQEPRGLAHFEDGPIAQAYRDNPRLDLHQLVADKVTEVLGSELSRKKAKVINLATMYGMGNGHAAELLGCSYEEARAYRQAYFKAFPSIRDLISDVTARGARGEPVRTWGGRLYYTEDPKEDEHGHVRRFEYKLFNVLVQGSSADLTKQALIDFWAVRGDVRVYATVHDEIVCSAPKETWKEDLALLVEVMNAPRWDVPMCSDSYVGPTWGDVKEVT